METNEKIYVGGFLVIAMILTGGVSYYVADTGEELTCRTGNGWEILEDHTDYYKVVCQYKTKEWEYALCSDFRATNSYPRYGCNVVALIEKEPSTDNNQDNIKTNQDNVRCTEVCPTPDVSTDGCYCI